MAQFWTDRGNGARPRIDDAVPGHWTERALPLSLRPYARLARLERPIGWWLLLLPGWWAIALAAVVSGKAPDARLLALFLAGAIVMRGAGCVYNDIVDRELDARVRRTRNRPLPAGDVSVRQALLFLLGLGAAGLAVLLQLNAAAAWLGVASLALVLAYPHMKHITYWPQAFLGLTFSWGAMLGWTAARGALEWPALALYAGGAFWTMAYDTIYAHQDREDDLLAGVKSTALLLGRDTPRWLAVFFALALAFLALAGWLAGAGWPFFAGVAGAGLHAIRQLRRLDIDDPASCLRTFRSNRDFGLIIFAGAVADAVF